MRSFAPALIVIAAGCDDYKSEREALGFDDRVLVVDRVGGFRSGGPVAVGSRACPTFEAWYERTLDGTEVRHSIHDPENDSWLRSCFSAAVAGPGSLSSDGCVHFEGVGEISWDLTPRACELPHGVDQFVADRVRFVALDRRELGARFDPFLDRLARAALHPGKARAFPSDFGTYLPPDVAIVAGGTTTFSLVAVDPHEGVVAWSDGGARARVIAGAPELPIAEESDLLTIRPAVGDAIEATLHIPGADLDAGVVVGVDSSEVASLEVVAVHWPRTEGGASSPIFARAIARDAGGSVLHGVPVEWAVTAGRLAVTEFREDESLPGTDYAYLEGACLPPRDELVTRAATLEARFGLHTAATDLEWIEDPIDCGDSPDCPMAFEPDAECEGPDEVASDDLGCSCGLATRVPVTPAVGLLAFLVAAGRRSRSRSVLTVRTAAVAIDHRRTT